LPAPGDRFVYVVSGGVGVRGIISVYRTDAAGVPQGTPIQVLGVPDTVENFEIGHDHHFAYAIQMFDDIQGFTVAKIRLFTVDPLTGWLGKSSTVEYTSKPNGPCGTGWSVEGFLEFSGFNADGSRLYVEWYCTTLDSISGIYDVFNVNKHSGKLSGERQIFEWSEDQSADGVWFTSRAAIDVGDPGYGQGLGWVTIYPPDGGNKSLFSCTNQMLEACGWGGFPDPTGEYMFLQDSGDSVIAKIELVKKEIVDTGTHIPQRFVAISPDRRLLYTQVPNQSDPFYLPIYTFNAKTGATREGGTIEVPAQSYYLYPAIRR
jgi:hypothetical protein